MADAEAATSEPPLAIVAEFAGPVSEDTLRELHRLAWNFSHAPTLVTIEPTILKVWTCCEAPDPSRDLSTYLVQNLASDAMSPHGSDPLEAQAARALHWINLASGRFFLAHAARLHRDGHMFVSTKVPGIARPSCGDDIPSRAAFAQMIQRPEFTCNSVRLFIGGGHSCYQAYILCVLRQRSKQRYRFKANRPVPQCFKKDGITYVTDTISVSKKDAVELPSLGCLSARNHMIEVHHCIAPSIGMPPAAYCATGRSRNSYQIHHVVRPCRQRMMECGHRVPQAQSIKRRPCQIWKTT